MSVIGPDSLQKQRQAAMAVLAHADTAEISRHLAGVPVPSHDNLREPENGLVMLRGRTGGDGAPFNLGEATVSRAAVRLVSGEIGIGYTLGRDRDKAQLVALCDALLQTPDHAAMVETQVLAPLRARIDTDRRRKAAEAAATRVDFYTLVRGRGRMTATMTDMPSGFANKALSAQSTFRSVMDAMARPGTLQRIAAPAGVPVPMMPGTAAIALTLFDQDAPVWLDVSMAAIPDAGKWIRFHCSAPIVADAGAAHFAVIGDPGTLTGFDDFALGSDEYPDRSATLIVQVESLSQGLAMELSGPGIDGTASLRATIGIPNLREHLAVNHTLFPRGIDLIFVAGESIVALPRTTRLTAQEG